MAKENKLTGLGRALAALDEDTVERLLNHCLAENIPPLQIIEEMSSGMDEVGRLFKEGEYFLSELIFSGEIFKNALSRVKPLMGDSDSSKSSGKVIIGTVKNDVHDLGKNIVCTMLECSGFEVIDLGVDVPPERFMEALKDSNASLVGMSVLLTTGFGSIEDTIRAINEAGLRDKVKIMIGGGCASENIKDQMGADYYGKDATIAVDIAKQVYAN